MTKERMRIVIAEWCGWRHEYDTKQLKAVWISPKSGYAYALEEDFVPNYPEDSNAIFDAEENLDPDGVINQRLTFAIHLGKLVHPDVSMNPAWVNWKHAHSTALQRCEALLRTLNLWEEDAK